MKKKIINGILLVAFLFATTSAFVSCKDTDSDVQTELNAKYAILEQKLVALQKLVDSINPCTCDKDAINKRLEALEAAVKTIPSLDGYLKTADLPALVQEMLKDYYTKAQVDALLADYAKKSELPKDVDLSNYFTKDQIAELLNEYAKKGDIVEVDLSKYLTAEQINALLADYAKKGDIVEVDLSKYLTAEQINALLADYAKKSDIDPGLTEAAVLTLISNQLAPYAKKTDIPDTFTKDEIIQIIAETIDYVDYSVNAIYMTEVTSLSIDQVVNPIFGFISPVGINSNILLACFGEKAARDIYFPKGADEPILYKGEYFLEGAGNAGKIYVTVNPSSVDFTGKTLKLVTTAGNEAPVELSPLVESNKELKYITRGDNAFYEAYATISEDKLANAYFSLEPTDMNAFKDDLKALIKTTNKATIAEMIQTVANIVFANTVPAYRLQAAWGDNYYTYSSASIAAIAIKPLSYTFDLSSEGSYEIDGKSPISALERLETKVVNKATQSESRRAQIWRWLNKFNKETEKWLNNVNWAIQPTLFLDVDNQIFRPGVEEFREVKAGEIKFLPSSWTAEVLAPAYKKYVAITSVNGTPVEANDPVNAGLLGKVIPGSVDEIPFIVEAGKTYEIQYSAVDFEGNIRTLEYKIKGVK